MKNRLFFKLNLILHTISLCHIKNWTNIGSLDSQKDHLKIFRHISYERQRDFQKHWKS